MRLKTLVGSGAGIKKKIRIRIRNKSFRIRNPAKKVDNTTIKFDNFNMNIDNYPENVDNWLNPVPAQYALQDLERGYVWIHAKLPVFLLVLVSPPRLTKRFRLISIDNLSNCLINFV